MNKFLSDFQLVGTKLFKRLNVTIKIPKYFLSICQKRGCPRTNNGNTQMLGLLLNVKSSSAKIRVPDPLLVRSQMSPMQNANLSF